MINKQMQDPGQCVMCLHGKPPRFTSKWPFTGCQQFRSAAGSTVQPVPAGAATVSACRIKGVRNGTVTPGYMHVWVSAAVCEGLSAP